MKILSILLLLLLGKLITFDATNADVSLSAEIAAYPVCNTTFTVGKSPASGLALYQPTRLSGLADIFVCHWLFTVSVKV